MLLTDPEAVNSTTVSLPVLAIQTLPPRSIERPRGPSKPTPLTVVSKAPEGESLVRVVDPSFEIHALPVASIATPKGVVNPVAAIRNESVQSAGAALNAGLNGAYVVAKE